MEPVRPTLDTVARAAGVSRMTVSNAYNRPDQLSAATRARVLAVAADLGYGGPDPAGRSLRRGRSGTVGVVLTDHLARAFSDPGMVSFLHGLAAALGEARQALLLLPVTDGVDERLVRDAVVDGFVLASLTRGAHVVDEVLGRRLPVVTSGSLRLSGVPNVGIDDVGAAHRLAEHLIALGHRRLAVVTVTFASALADDSSTRDGVVRLALDAAASVTRQGGMQNRVQGFRAGVEEAGAAGAEVTVLGVATNDRASGAAAFRSLLNGPEPERPTAVFCVTDILALGGLDAAAELGVAVPAELSVVGFDGIDEAEHSDPPLTTVRQDLFGQGRVAADLLLAVVAGRLPRSVRRPTELVVGGSTGPAPASPPQGRARTRPPERRGSSRVVGSAGAGKGSPG
jgi:DNA-binding LacI/PurR family transcriptional regulator